MAKAITPEEGLAEDLPSPSERRYLKSIHRLGGDEETVRTMQIARFLNVRPPSVTEMLRHLSEVGWVEHRPRKGTVLTDSGVRLARRIIRRHRLLELFLSQVLRLDWSEVHAEAESIEYAVSPSLERRIAIHLGDPTEDPHGHVIPTVTGVMNKPMRKSLTEFPQGARVRIREVSDDDPRMLRLWRSKGIALGAIIRLGAEASKTTVRIEIGESALMLSRKELIGLYGEEVVEN